MLNLGLQPIFAINGEGIISLIVITFVVVSGIVNFLKEKSQTARRQANRQRADLGQGQGKKSIQNEIDQFLKEVGGKPKRSQQPIEIVEVDEPVRRQRRPQPQQRRPQTRQRRPATQQRRQTQAARQPPTRKRKPGAKLHDRKAPGSQDLGGDVREHVQEHMQRHIATEAQENIAHDVNKSVQQHLGTFRAGERNSTPTIPLADRVNARTIVELLRTPAGIQQAILLHEILSRPKGLK